MKSEITKGALYLFDDAFRPRRAMVMATVMATATATEMAKGSVYLTKYKPFESGLAILGEIVKHPEDSMWDVCQLLFNNKNGIRYIYRNELEHAKKVSK